MKNRFAVLAFLAVSLVGLQAQTASISVAEPLPTMVFSPDGASVSGYFTLSVSGNGAGVPYHTWTDAIPESGLRMTWTRFGSSVQANAPFEVYKDLVKLDVLTIRKGSDVSPMLYKVLYGNESVQVPYHVRLLPGGSTPQPGVYTTTITLRCFGSDNLNSKGSNLNATKSVELSFVVSPQAAIDITTNDPSRNVVFGDVSAGTATPQDFSVTVRSNFRYSLRVSSANGGILLNPLGEPGERISYFMQIGGLTPDITVRNAPVPIALNEPFTGNDALTGGKTYSGSIALGEVKAFTTGEYRDTLTFSVSAQ